MLWTPDKHYLADPFEDEAQLEAAIVSVSSTLFGPNRIYLSVKKLIGAKGKTKNIPDGYLIDLASKKEPRLFVVENEITYLAFPRVPDALVVFGSGFGLASLRPLPWLVGKEIVYWGDIDTHGFDILNRLRSRFDSVRSILMDEATLLAHRSQWVTEPSPTDRPLANLTEAESALYGDLVEDRFGAAVRLEQERVRPSLLERELQSLSA